jgi:two-component system, NarL family, invasion response regulator UvrY
MSTDPIRIILVDDHKLARESLCLLLGYDARFCIEKDCDNGHDAVDHARTLRPDVMLVDVNMEPMNGFEVVRTVLKNDPTIKIIGISVNNHPMYATRMLEMGALGFVTKGSTLDEMTHAIMEVFNGRQYVSSDIRPHLPR